MIPRPDTSISSATPVALVQRPITSREVQVSLSKTASILRPTSGKRPSISQNPLGFPTRAPSGLVPADQALKEALVGQVLAKFEKAFEQRLSQVEVQAPRARSHAVSTGVLPL